MCQTIPDLVWAALIEEGQSCSLRGRKWNFTLCYTSYKFGRFFGPPCTRLFLSLRCVKFCVTCQCQCCTTAHLVVINSNPSLDTRHSLRPLLSCNFQASGKDWTVQPSLPSLTRDHPHLRFFTSLNMRHQPRNNNNNNNSLPWSDARLLVQVELLPTSAVIRMESAFSVENCVQDSNKPKCTKNHNLRKLITLVPFCIIHLMFSNECRLLFSVACA